MGYYKENGEYEFGFVEQVMNRIGLPGVLAVIGILCSVVTIMGYAAAVYYGVKLVVAH